MPIPIKLDEPLSGSIAHPLRARGHAVLTVVEQGWGGKKDAALWPLVQAEHIFFITADKGFGDLRQFAPGTHAGILLLRADKESIPAYLALMQKILDQYQLDDLVGCVTVATPRSVRVRRAKV